MAKRVIRCVKTAIYVYRGKNWRESFFHNCLIVFLSDFERQNWFFSLKLLPVWQNHNKRVKMNTIGANVFIEKNLKLSTVLINIEVFETKAKKKTIRGVKIVKNVQGNNMRESLFQKRQFTILLLVRIWVNSCFSLSRELFAIVAKIETYVLFGDFEPKHFFFFLQKHFFKVVTTASHECRGLVWGRIFFLQMFHFLWSFGVWAFFFLLAEKLVKCVKTATYMYMEKICIRRIRVQRNILGDLFGSRFDCFRVFGLRAEILDFCRKKIWRSFKKGIRSSTLRKNC